jgi:hypothetical protein
MAPKLAKDRSALERFRALASEIMDRLKGAAK